MHVRPNPQYSKLLLALSLLTPLVCANWRYKSRPDLSPPTLNITIRHTGSTASQLSPGYLFLAPFSGFSQESAGPGSSVRHGPLQAAPYIFTDRGELVWSGFTYFSSWTTNFQVVRWQGKEVLAAFEGSHNAAYGHGHGHTTFLNEQYETIKELRAGNHRLTDKHEFHVIGEETALIQIYHPVPWNLTAYGGSEEQQWIVDARFQELSIETDEVLYEWSSLDHVDPSEGYLPLNPGQAGSGYSSSDAWDYFHINSVDKDSEGNYLISARDANAVYKINGTTGAIIWQLSGKSTDFKLGKDVEFAFQHHARFVSKSADGKKEIISLFDNSAHGTENGKGKEVHFHKYSRGKIIEVDTERWEATTVQTFNPPDNLLAKSQGSTQLLPNGNVLVNWGSEGAVTEFTSDGTPIFHAYADSGPLGVGVQNYRAFRFNWTGIPNEAPAIVVLKDDRTSTSSVYVSWNGDTRTTRWRFYELVGGSGERKILGEIERDGFETVLQIAGREVQRVQAEALDAEGTVLIQTAAVESDPLIREYKRPKKKQPKEWKQETKGILDWLQFKGQKVFGNVDL